MLEVLESQNSHDLEQTISPSHCEKPAQILSPAVQWRHRLQVCSRRNAPQAPTRSIL